MPYQTGSVASFSALKTEIISFLVANGWTAEIDIVKRNGVFAKITAGSVGTDGSTYIQLEGGKGSDGGGNLVDKHDNPAYPWQNNAGRMTSHLGVGSAGGVIFPITYNFQVFSAPVDEFWCVIQFNGDVSQHLGFGNINKSAPFSGGGFYSCSAGSFEGGIPSVYYTFDANNIVANGMSSDRGAVEHIPFNGNTTFNFAFEQFSGSAIHAEIGGLEWFMSGTISGMYPAPGRMIRGQTDVYERNVSQSTVNGVPNLVPIRLYGRSLSNNMQNLGTLENMRFAQIGNMNFGQVETDGTDRWKFYPAYKKDASDPNGGVDHTGIAGLAIRYDGP